MTFLKSTLMASALILGTTTAAFAQDAMVDKAKDMAVETGTDMAKDEAKKHMGKTGEHAMKAGEHMMKGDSAKDAVMKVGASEAKSQAQNTTQGMATDMVKEQVMGDTMMTEKGTMDGDDMMTAGKVMVKGGSVEDAAMAVATDNAKDTMMNKAQGVLKSDGVMTDNVMGEKMLTEKGKMDGDDMMTAGKVMIKGGSAEEAAMAVAKDNAKDAVMGQAKGMMKDKMMHQGTVKTTTPMVSTPAAADINCPSGTTAQANGTCMVTGDYQPRG